MAECFLGGFVKAPTLGTYEVKYSTREEVPSFSVDVTKYDYFITSAIFYESYLSVATFKIENGELKMLSREGYCSLSVSLNSSKTILTGAGGLSYSPSGDYWSHASAETYVAGLPKE